MLKENENIRGRQDRPLPILQKARFINLFAPLTTVPSCLVPSRGLEPLRVTPYAPKAYAYTNSATKALTYNII